MIVRYRARVVLLNAFQMWFFQHMRTPELSEAGDFRMALHICTQPVGARIRFGRRQQDTFMLTHREKSDVTTSYCLASGEEPIEKEMIEWIRQLADFIPRWQSAPYDTNDNGEEGPDKPSIRSLSQLNACSETKLLYLACDQATGDDLLTLNRIVGMFKRITKGRHAKVAYDSEKWFKRRTLRNVYGGSIGLHHPNKENNDNDDDGRIELIEI